MYYVVKCPRCKMVFITRSSKRVRCISCKRTFKVQDNLIGYRRTYDEAVNLLYKSTGIR